MQLVKARAGLTNYYHNQVIRNSALDIDSTIIDGLTEENIHGGISGASLLHAAVMSGGLNAQASGYANIAGGWNESKGLMHLTFLVQETPVNAVYMNVIGYVTNNGSMEGLTTDAIFTPVMSWKVHETLTASLMIDNPTQISRMVGGRTDYILNDGSQNQVISLRPNDVIDYSIERANQEDIMKRMQDEGLDAFTPTTTVGASDISRVGVVASKRANVNPSMYAADILKAGTGFQRDMQVSSNMMDSSGTNESEFDGVFGQLANMAYQQSNTEPALIRDDLFHTMMDMMGTAQMRGFRGWTILDLITAFDNLNDVLDLTLMNADQFPTADFTLNTEVMGTSQIEDIISQEITLNIMDLMIKHSLTMVNFRGSNCDNYGGDGSLSNIVIVPYNPASLTDDDFNLGQNAIAFTEELKGQIFAKLNGVRVGSMTPVRFDVSAELFGTCVVNITTVNENNQGLGFSMNDTGIPDGMFSRCFPTFALNNFSNVVGDKEAAQIAGSNFFSNLETYFKY